MARAVALVLLFLLPGEASALPRFAARTSMRCLQCHESPGGGGPRNAYGRVFASEWLSLSSAVADWMTPEDDDTVVPFDGSITEWLAVGGDLRAVYNLVAPRDGEIFTTFFLMQADLYHSAHLGDHLTLVLDVGVNSGFEAWAALFPFPELDAVDVIIRAGRFFPAFGIRFANHTLFTRERIGFGPSAQDTGIEAVLDSRYFALTLGLLNGTFGDVFDLPKRTYRAFDKAALARLEGRLRLGDFRLALGGSLYYNQNFDRANPLFAPRIDPTLALEGLDELRAGGFLTLNFGRFTLLADAVYVRDRFYAALPRAHGFAGYVELDFLILQGLEALVGWEVADTDLEVRSRLDHRVSFAIELFPILFTELRAMARHTFGVAPASELVAFLHVYL